MGDVRVLRESTITGDGPIAWCRYDGDGVVSGYLLEDISVGVLSIPTFDVVPQSIGNFSSAVVEFMGNASNAGMQKVVIDLERNMGGATSLSYLIFKLFFPELMPYAGSRRRSFDLANTLG